MNLQQRINQAIRREYFKSKMSEGKAVQASVNSLQEKVDDRLTYLKNTKHIGPDYRH